MKLISSNNELRKELSRLINSSSEIYIAVAWASSGTEEFQLLLKHKKLIKKAIIGTHFYQTDPEVLKSFYKSKNVKFILKPTGVFHPKIYLFLSENNWEALIGSANFTHGALYKNSEVMIHVRGHDKQTLRIKNEILKTISSYWNNAKFIVNEAAIKKYHASWKKRPKHKYHEKNKSKKSENQTPFDSIIMQMAWKDFLSKVQSKGKYLSARGELLSFARDEFSKRKFSDMDEQTRRVIAGLPNEYDYEWGAFGSMKGAGKFFKAIRRRADNFSKALDNIPLRGTVTKDQYLDYISVFKKALPKRHGVSTATRLLAMKRPDQFICINSKNKRGLCKGLGIRQLKTKDYDRYWDDVIERIRESAWWNAPKPKNKSAQIIWQGRTSFLDALYYRP